MRAYTERLKEMLRTDIEQRAEEGVDVVALRRECESLLAGDPPLSALLALHERILRAPIAADWPYHEPSDWDGIAACLPSPCARLGVLSSQELHDRILGGWLGRCAGCLLGKPLEGIRKRDDDPRRGHRDYVRDFLQDAGAWPLRGYVPYVPPEERRYTLSACWPEATAGHIAGMPRDDDIDYAILNLLMCEKYGLDWTPEQAFTEWLRRLPYWQVYSAGRAAYGNFAAGVAPDHAAVVGNASRQSLGGMIRADLWGWISPGRPAVAARLAFRDSAMSQTQNGIYAGMFWAATIALAFVVRSPRQAMELALLCIPPVSRLAEAVKLMLDTRDTEPNWERAVDVIYQRYSSLPFNHSLPNTAIAVMGLLYGQREFSLSIERTVMAGFDTDCTGATVGSVMGVLLGAKDIPGDWTEPLQDRVTTSVAGLGTVRISELAERTLRLAVVC